jgi:hypothetical protein
MRRWLAIAVLALALPVPAAAHGDAGALVLVFNRKTGPIGSTVSGRTPVAANAVLRKMVRSGALRRHPLRLFLASTSEAGSIGTVRDTRLTPVGALGIDRRGRGRVTFGIPNLAPGDYTTLLQCVPCRPPRPARALVRSGPYPTPLRVVDGPPVVRDCASSVSGRLPPDWQQYTVTAGPLTLYYWNGSTLTDANAFAPSAPARYKPIKILALVRGAAAVTLSVPLDERRKVALVYGRPSEWRTTMRVSDGRAATSFRACPELNETQFNGGFVVAGVQCARFDVHVEGRSEPLSLAVPFGTSC